MELHAIDSIQRSLTVVRQKVAIPILDGEVEGDFFTFTGLADGEHVAVGFGDWKKQSVPLIRLHSECLTGDLFRSAKCDCGPQLQEAVVRFAKEGGVLLYLRQEGRGIGLYNKLDAYALQSKGFNTFEANRLLNFRDDQRDYRSAAHMLRALEVTTVRLLTNNPDKAAQLSSYGIQVQQTVPTGVYLNPHNQKYLDSKVQYSSHRLFLEGKNDSASVTN